MKLVKHYPGMRKRNSLFPSLFDEIFNPNMEQFVGYNTNDFTPSVNVVKSKDGYRLDLIAPGRKKEDFKLDVEDEVLNISAEVKVESTEEKEQYTRKEFRYSSFSRSFTLPEFAVVDKIKATYTDGVLSIEIPVKEEVKKDKVKMIKVA